MAHIGQIPNMLMLNTPLVINQVIAGMISSREGWLVQAADATLGAKGGSFTYQ